MPATGNLPVLYSFRRCPYAMRARLAIASSGYQCELREIVLRDKAPEFLEVSPKGTVPVLITSDGEVIEESFDIMLRVLKENDPEGWLSPGTGTLADMTALVSEFDGPFKSALDRYKYATRYEGVDPTEERGKGCKYLLKLETRLENSEYLFGQNCSLADMAILPFVRQFANVDRAWFDAQDWPDLISWLENFLDSPKFNHIFKKYKKWHIEGDITSFS